MAESISKDYVEDRELRLLYLRSKSFDVTEATKRFMIMFQQKLLYFGPEKIAKHITLTDLTEDEIELLESGMIQELAETDSSGRTVVVFLRQLRLMARAETHVSFGFVYLFVSLHHATGH
jgi:hypothetical protein